MRRAAAPSASARPGVRKKADRDPAFARSLKAARGHRAAPSPSVEQLDWREIAVELERENPAQWSLSNPFDLDGAA